jgi:hypothetical protein
MKFNKKQKDQSSEISTASMPDIVFLLLFFFMVSATIKPKEDMLRIDDPKAHAITVVKKKFLIKELHIGVPKNSSLGTSPRISDGESLLGTPTKSSTRRNVWRPIDRPAKSRRKSGNGHHQRCTTRTQKE